MVLRNHNATQSSKSVKITNTKDGFISFVKVNHSEVKHNLQKKSKKTI